MEKSALNELVQGMNRPKSSGSFWVVKQKIPRKKPQKNGFFSVIFAFLVAFKSRHLNHEEPKLNTQVFDLGSFVIFGFLAFQTAVYAAKAA